MKKRKSRLAKAGRNAQPGPAGKKLGKQPTGIGKFQSVADTGGLFHELQDRLLFDHSIDAVLLTTPQGKILAANSEACRLFGYSEEEIIRLGRAGLVDSSDPRLGALLEERTRTGRARGELTFVRKDGTRFPCEVSSAVFNNRNGSSRTSMIVRDITERKQSEELRRKELERTSMLLELYTKASQWTDGEVFEYALEKAVNLTGSKIGYLHRINDDQTTLSLTAWNKEALKLCTAAYETHYPLSEAGIWADCARLRRPVLHNNYQVLPDKKGYPEGHTNLVRHLSLPVIDGDQIRLILGVGNKEANYDEDDVLQLQLVANELHKIMVRRRAEDALRKSEVQYRTLVQSSPYCIHEIDLQGKLISMNRAGLAMMGFQSETEILGVPYLQAVADADKERIGQFLEHALKGQSSEFEFEASNGLFLASSFVPIVGAVGTVVRIMGLTQDITNRKQAEAKLLDYQQQLRCLTSELSRAEQHERRRIAALLHDDVIQSLALCKIELGVLRKRLSVPEQQSFLDAIRGHLEQAIHSTRSLTFQLSPPILHELGLEPALDWLCEQIAQQHGLRCCFESDGQPKPLDEETKIFLFTATRELLLNVIKHAKAASAKVSSAREYDTVRIVVEDDGSGFDARQTNICCTKAGGFGLFNIRERLGYLGGHFEVQSESVRGTRVALAVPLKRASG